MKTTFKVLIAVFALGIVILTGLHLFLQYGLTKTLRDVVLPQLKAETGIDAQVGRLSLNVAKANIHLKEIEVKNPEGFLLENLASIKQIDVEVDLASLFKKKLILVRHIQVKQALLNVVRNKQGEINIYKLQESLPQRPLDSQPVPGMPESGGPTPEYDESVPGRVPDGGGVAEPQFPESPKSAPAELPEILIETLQCKATVRYVDLKLNQLDIALYEYVKSTI